MMSAVQATGCPEPEKLSSFVEDALSGDDRTAIEDHLDTCDECRSTVAMLARAATAEQERTRPSSLMLPTNANPASDVHNASTAVPAGGAKRRPPYNDPGGVGRTTRPRVVPDAAGEPAEDALAATEIAGGPQPTLLEPSQRKLRALQSRFPAGTKLGRYVLGDTLGVGGMGIVYVAHDPDLHRDVAIKILKPEFAKIHPDATRRIVREARAMARVAHPNVVSVYDVGTLEDQVFVAMERVTGTNLRSWLEAARRTTAEILEVFTAAGRGLIAAHDAGMVHRDFKPDNVLVGADARVRVTDFGLAFDLADVDAPGVVAGTPAYMAPEQYEGGNIDARTDQFSFAVSLYEALYGVRPFAGATRDSLGEAVVHGRIEPPPARSNVPASLRAILLRALAVTPGDRFPTLSDLLKALGRDRGRRPRQLAYVALIAFVGALIALGADAIVRNRTRAVTRTSFAAARAQLDKLVSLRTETFVAQSDALYLLPPVQAVAASPDFADFGLGEADEDLERRKIARDALLSQSWLAAKRMSHTDTVAIADRKGRLLYTSAKPDAWDNNIADVPVIAAAFDARKEVYLGVVKGDDPIVMKSRLLGGAPRAGLFVVFGRTKRIDDRPRALFVQFADATRVLDEVSTGTDTLLSVVALGGEAQGAVPPEVVAGASGGGISELTIDGHEWLVERTPLRAGEDAEAIAQLVLARRSDAGLAGLFPYARLTLVVLSILCGGAAAGGLLLARRRDLTRARGA